MHQKMYRLSAPWESAVEEWLTRMKLSGVPSTTQSLRRGHTRWVGRNTGTTRPAEVTAAMLRALFSSQKWSNEYRRSMRRSLVAFYDWLIAEHLATENPAAALPRVKVDPPKPRPYPDQLWRELLMTAPPREQMMVRLAGEVGMRRSEVAQCHRDDLTEDHSGWSLLVHGKNGKQRWVPITERLANDIRAYCKGGYLFPGELDGHLQPSYVGRRISELMPSGWSMHKLRHRYASRGLAGTGNLLAVRDALGHASVATTQIYTKVISSDVRRVAEAAAADADLT